MRLGKRSRRRRTTPPSLARRRGGQDPETSAPGDSRAPSTPTLLLRRGRREPHPSPSRPAGGGSRGRVAKAAACGLEAGSRRQRSPASHDRHTPLPAPARSSARGASQAPSALCRRARQARPAPPRLASRPHPAHSPSLMAASPLRARNRTSPRSRLHGSRPASALVATGGRTSFRWRIGLGQHRRAPQPRFERATLLALGKRRHPAGENPHHHRLPACAAARSKEWGWAAWRRGRTVGCGSC